MGPIQTVFENKNGSALEHPITDISVDVLQFPNDEEPYLDTCSIGSSAQGETYRESQAKCMVSNYNTL